MTSKRTYRFGRSRTQQLIYHGPGDQDFLEKNTQQVYLANQNQIIQRPRVSDHHWHGSETQAL